MAERTDSHPQPLVSVCVQTYRHADYIGACLEGILMQQTTFPYEIVLGEDASDDGTREICETYAQKHPDRIRLFLRSREDVITINGRPTGRYNLMQNLHTARGRYIAICEGDDCWTDPLKLQTQFDWMETHPGAGICFHVVREENVFDVSKSKRLPEIDSDADFSITDYIRSNRTATCSMFIKKASLMPLPEWFPKVLFGDLAMTLICLHRSGEPAHVFSRPMGIYTIHGGGTHGSLQRDLKQRTKAFVQHLEFFRMLRKKFFKDPAYDAAILNQLVFITETIRNEARQAGMAMLFARATLFFYYYRTIRKISA